MTTLRFGFSPCPNDTVQFYALLHGKIDTGPLTFQPVIADVEELNRLALSGELELTKASYGALGRLLPRYLCLSAGGALGHGCGPLWVTKGNRTADELAKLPIAHPGENTTAHLLLQLRLKGKFQGAPMVFHEIFDAVESGRAASGVIIHEGRFTYEARGLTKVEDLGQWWETATGAPIPLGCILLRRDLEGVDPLFVEGLLRQSLAWARANPGETMRWVRSLAQEMEGAVIAEHIRLYVNNFSEDLGLEGRKAVTELLERQSELGLLSPFQGKVFAG